jgi:hypothetical protein
MFSVLLEALTRPANGSQQLDEWVDGLPLSPNSTRD